MEECCSVVYGNFSQEVVVGGTENFLNLHLAGYHAVSAGSGLHLDTGETHRGG